MKNATLSLLSLSVLSGAVLASCVPTAPLDGQSCPCATGWVCCPGDNACVKEASSCPGPEAPPASSTDGAAQASHDGGAPPSVPAEPAYTLPSALAGTWTGYQENLDLYEVSDVVKVVVGANADGSSKVTVTFGTKSAPPPATDPNTFWPAGKDEGGVVVAGDAPIVEGFVYTARMVRIDGQRLRFRIVNSEPWQPWCALQTSHLIDPARGYYSTVPAASFGMTPSGCTTAAGDAFPCASIFGINTCWCDADGCRANIEGSAHSFDLNFQGDTVNGTADAYGNHNVRLTRTK